jgi:uncharacterized glyoxalase superfamily protein PhnB
MKMKRIILLAGILTAIIATLVASTTQAQTNKQPNTMKLNAGIVTSKLSETKEFYTKVLNFGVSFENEFYLLLHTPNQQDEISFLLPNHPTQNQLFKPSFMGKGMYLTIHVENVDQEYDRIKSLGFHIAIEMKNEPWGDRHFAVVDPNGIGLDIVTYTKPTE